MFFEKFVSLATLRRLYGVLGLWLLVGILVLGILPWLVNSSRFRKSSYTGTIDSIVYRDGNRGVPYILMNDEWRILKVEELKALPFLKAGDSIVKKSGVSSLQIYRIIEGDTVMIADIK